MICTIDAGYSGAIMISDIKGVVLFKSKLPIDNNGMLSGKQLYDLLDKTNTGVDIKNIDLCVIEHLHSIYGIKASSNWKLAESFGSLYTFATTVFHKVILVRPKVWKKEVIKKQDIVLNKKDKKDNKKTAIKAAERLLEKGDFRDVIQRPGGKIWDHNYCDCFLISRWYYNTHKTKKEL